MSAEKSIGSTHGAQRSKYANLAFFILVFLFSQSIFAITSSAEQLSHLLNNFTTYQANFSQVTEDAHQQLMQRSSGIMMIMRPNHFRWETKKPEHQIVITDGKTMWIYDVDLQQVTKQSIQNSPVNPAKLLSGNVNELVQQFNVSDIRDGHFFILTPKKPNPDFKSITIIFHNQKLICMKIVSSMNQTSIFNFTNIVINAHLSPTTFQLKTSKNVDILK